MMLKEIDTNCSSLNFLQQPIHPGQGMSDSFWSLLAAVDQGWQVEGPVKKFPCADLNSWKYQFVMVHKGIHRICKITVPASPDADHFIFINDCFVETISVNQYKEHNAYFSKQ